MLEILLSKEMCIRDSHNIRLPRELVAAAAEFAVNMYVDTQIPVISFIEGDIKSRVVRVCKPVQFYMQYFHSVLLSIVVRDVLMHILRACLLYTSRCV